MKKLLLAALLLIPVLAFSGCAGTADSIDSAVGLNPHPTYVDGCTYGVNCGKVYKENGINNNQVPPPINKTMQSQN
jgi:hypothetical protein